MLHENNIFAYDKRIISGGSKYIMLIEKYCVLLFLIMVKTRILICFLIILLRRRSYSIRQRKRRITWVKDWIKNRESQGAFHQLMKEISLIDTSSYRNFVRMDATTFEELLTMISPRIHRQNTVMRKAICPGERLAITLRFLATGKYIQYIQIVL